MKSPTDLVVGVSGDWHLRFASPRFATCKRVLYWIADDAAQRGANLFLQIGDYFDTASGTDDRLEGRDLDRHYSDRFPFGILGGNHDEEKDLSIHDSFRAKHPIHVFDEPGVKDLEIGGHALRIGAFPDLRGAYLARRIAALTKRHPDRPARAIDVARETLNAMATRMRSAVGPRLFMGHLTMGGARMDNDQPARTVELSHSLPDLAAIQAHAYVLGHIHLRQAWDIAGAPVFYTGSPYGCSYGDLSPKSYSLLRWDGSRFEVEIISTPAPRLVLVVGSWQRDGDTGTMSLAYAKEHEAEIPVVMHELAGAEVKLRFKRPLDDKEAAERAAENHKLAMEGAGALKVDLDPQTTNVIRTQTSSVTIAKTTGDKVDAFWKSTNTVPDLDRRERVLAYISRWEARVPPNPPVGLVHLDSLAWEGIGPLKPAGKLRFDRPGVHAIVGPNRAGKSTLLSLLSSAMWVRGSRGSVDRFARPKGAILAVEGSTRAGAWAIEQNLTGGTTTVRGVFAGGREKYYDWARKNLPSLRDLERLSFLPSKRNGLLDLYDTELKRTLLSMAGSAHLVALAEVAREELREAQARRKALLETLGRVSDPTRSLAASEADHAAARAHLEKTLAQHRAGAELLTLLTDERRLLADRKRAEATLANLAERRTELEKQRSSDMGRLFLAAELEEVVTDLQARRAHASLLESEEGALISLLESLKDQQDRATSHAREERARAARMAARGGRRGECEAAVAALPEAQATLTASESAAAVLASQGGNEGHRSALTEIHTVARAAHLKPSIRYQDPALVQIRDRAEAALALDTSGNQLPQALATRDAASRKLASLQRLADLLPDIAACEMERAAADAAADEEEGSVALLAMKLRAEEAKLSTLRTTLREEEDACDRLTGEESRLQGELAELDGASRAKEMIFVLQGQERSAEETRHQIDTRLGEVRAQLATLRTGWTGRDPTEDSQSALHTTVMQAQRAAARLEEVVSRHREALRAYEADHQKLDLLERELGDLTEALRVVDKNGAQAFEADAVGTEIALTASDLLQTHGFRWLLRYDSVRQSETKTDVEQARWMVVNQETGEEYEARELGGSSGGEEVISGTAIVFGANAAVVDRGGGVKDALLTLDERASAVREDLVGAWLAMIRDGAARVGISTVLLVPPNDPTLISACDGIVSVTPTATGSVVEWQHRGWSPPRVDAAPPVAMLP